MRSPLSSIIHRMETGHKLNILTCPTHERYQSNFDDINANFFMWRGQGIKDWNEKFAPLPTNHYLLGPCQNLNLAYEAVRGNNLPTGVPFDLVLSQHKFGQYQTLAVFSKLLHIPIISLEHTLPMPTWGHKELELYHNKTSHANVFISDYNREKWGYDENEAFVIEHCVNSDIFKNLQQERKSQILTVANEYATRGHLLGWDIYQQVVNGLPIRPVGDTPGFSEPAETTEELVQEYNSSTIFLNTSVISPIPSSLLEAAACGCAIVSTNNCMIPDIFTHGKDAFLSNDVDELRKFIEHLLQNPQECEKMGKEASETVYNRFNKKRFTKEWQSLFDNFAQIKYTGVEDAYSRHE